MATVQKEQRSSTDPTPHSVVRDKLSSPLKQEIRTMYHLKLAKHNTVCKQLEADNHDKRQSQQHKDPVVASPIASSPNARGYDGSPQRNGNCVKRKLVYPSEKQSKMSPTIAAPDPPPCTPDNPGFKKRQKMCICCSFNYRME